jgi:hypothetical protein
MPRYHNKDGVHVQFTAEEEAARDAEEKAWADSANDRAFAILREERDKLLDGTDWVITMHKELGTNIPSAWKTYRQELRDLPANTSDPTDVTWPTKPS